MSENGAALMDVDGDIIDHFTQWDLNQEVYIDAGELTVEPMFHFANKSSKSALGVESVLVGGMFKARVPNILLQEALPINIWVYVVNEDFSETVYTFYVPVQERLRPPDYVYEETDLVSNVAAMVNSLYANLVFL